MSFVCDIDSAKIVWDSLTDGQRQKILVGVLGIRGVDNLEEEFGFKPRRVDLGAIIRRITKSQRDEMCRRLVRVIS